MSIVSENKEAQWNDRIEAWRGSGVSAAEWCRNNNVVYHRFCYWRKRLFQLHSGNESFIELRDEQAESGILIKLGKIDIHLSKEFDELTLQRTLRAVNGSC